MVWQVSALLADGRTAFTHPNWWVVAGFARAILYAAFLSILVVAVLLREQPFDRDGRLLIRGTAVTASFLLVLLGELAPAGPLLLRVPALVAGAAAVVTLGGVLFALGGGTRARNELLIRPSESSTGRDWAISTGPSSDVSG